MIYEKGDEMENFNNEPTLFDSMGKGISVSKENLPTETGKTAQSALTNGSLTKFGETHQNNGEVVISTLEIAKITQKEHKNIMRDCSVNLSKVCSLLNFEQTYQNAQNKQFYKHYLLPKREALILVSGYSVELRAKIIDRLTELENELKKQTQPTFKLPQTFAEALRDLADSVEKVAELENKLTKQKPLVEFAENVAHSVNSISVNEFAKILSIKDFGEKKLFAWLRKNDFLNAFNQPYQKYVNLGLFELKEGTYATQKGLNTYTQTLITGKGQIYLSEKIENFLKGGEND